MAKGAGVWGRAVLTAPSRSLGCGARHCWSGTSAVLQTDEDTVSELLIRGEMGMAVKSEDCDAASEWQGGDRTPAKLCTAVTAAAVQPSEIRLKKIMRLLQGLLSVLSPSAVVCACVNAFVCVSFECGSRKGGRGRQRQPYADVADAT